MLATARPVKILEKQVSCEAPMFTEQYDIVEYT